MRPCLPAHAMTRRLLPTCLIALGVFLLVGCLYIPTWEIIRDHADVKRVAEQKGSQKLVAHRTTRQVVESMLGKPPLSTSDGRVVGYLWNTSSGYWVYPQCFSAIPAQSRTCL